jgi:4-amino-4-deoxy-L-arabinose transferase-like glycosyltransferase
MNFHLTSHRTKLILIVICFIAILLRLFWVLTATQIDPALRANPLHGDATGYWLIASNLYHTSEFAFYPGVPTSYRMPGYPVFLALIFSIFGEQQIAVRVMQALLGGVLCLVIYAIGKELFQNRATALLASAGAAIYPLLIYVTGWIYSETLFILLFWLGILFLIRWVKTQSKVNFLSGSLLIGLATYFRPEIFPLGAYLFGVFFLLRFMFKLRSAPLMGFIILQGIVLIILLPWSIRNTILWKEITLLTTSGGSNFYAGNNPQSNGGSAWLPVVDGMTEPESDHYLMSESQDWIKANPGLWLELFPKKMGKFFSPVELETRNSPIEKISFLINIAYAIFLLVALYGLVSCRGSLSSLLLAAIYLWYLITALAFFGGSRVALPVSPVIILFFSNAIVGLSQRLIRSQTLTTAPTKG